MTFDSPMHRAAVLVKSLPQAQANKLLAHLESDELQTLFRKIRSLQPSSENERSMAARKMIAAIDRINSDRSFQKRSMNPPSVDSGPFDFMLRTTEENRFKLLASEHPANIATVFTFLPTKAASAILGRFEPNVRVSILRRLCQIEDSKPKRVTDLSNHLKNNLRKLLNSGNFNQVGIDVATKLLSFADPQSQVSIINCINDQDSVLAKEIRNSVFRFENFLLFTNADIKLILKFADTSCWAPALKNADSKLRRKILRNFAERPKSILGREIRSLKNVSKDIEQAAQLELVQTVLQLAERCVISLPEIQKRGPIGKAA